METRAEVRVSGDENGHNARKGYFTDREWTNVQKGLGVVTDIGDAYALLKEGVEWGWIARSKESGEFRNRFTALALKEFAKHDSWDKENHLHWFKVLFLTLHSIKMQKKDGVVTFYRPHVIPDEAKHAIYRYRFQKFAKGRTVNVECEDSTTTKPARILQNLAKGKNEGKPVNFMAENEEVAEKIISILRRPYREYKDGTYEYYMSDTNEPFIPEKEFKDPIKDSDWRVDYAVGEDSFVEYIEPSVVAPNGEKQGSFDTRNGLKGSANAEMPIITKLDALETFLADNSGAHSLTQLREAFGTERGIMCAMLAKLIVRGTVLKEDRGMYIHKKWVAFN